MNGWVDHCYGYRRKHGRTQRVKKVVAMDSGRSIQSHNQSMGPFRYGTSTTLEPGRKTRSRMANAKSKFHLTEDGHFPVWMERSHDG